MPLTRFLVVALSSGLCAWAGWSVGVGAGPLAGFLLANMGFSIGWYFGRAFVRNNLD